MTKLSVRLSAIADFVKKKAAVCDVGTDRPGVPGGQFLFAKGVKDNVQ